MMIINGYLEFFFVLSVLTFYSEAFGVDFISSADFLVGLFNLMISCIIGISSIDFSPP